MIKLLEMQLRYYAMAGGDISLVCIIEDVSNLHSRSAWSSSHRDQTETITVCLFPICLSLSQTIVAIQCISQNYCQLYRHQFIISTNATKDIITKWFKEWTCHGVCTVCTLWKGAKKSHLVGLYY